MLVNGPRFSAKHGLWRDQVVAPPTPPNPAMAMRAPHSRCCSAGGSQPMSGHSTGLIAVFSPAQPALVGAGRHPQQPIRQPVAPTRGTGAWHLLFLTPITPQIQHLSIATPFPDNPGYVPLQVNWPDSWGAKDRLFPRLILPF